MSESSSLLREFMPHGMCYAWQTDVLLLNVVSDVLISASYFSIPLTLAYFLHNRPSLPFRTLVILFSAFILACGATHLLGVWVVWHGHYGVQGVFKSVTAAVSIATAIALFRFMPMLLTMPSPVKLANANRALQEEITERTRIEAQFRNFVEAAPDAIVILDHGGQIQLVNSQTEHLFGYGRDELINKPIEMLIPSGLDVGSAAKTSNHKERGLPPSVEQGSEFVGSTKENRTFPVELSLSSVGSEDQPLVSASMRDISDRIAKEAQNRELQADLAHVARLTTMGEMAAGLAHELNQPLTAITQNTDTALFKLKQSTTDTNEFEELLRDIEEEARRGGEIIRALRELVRKGNEDRQPIDINELIEKTIRLVGPEARDQRVQITHSETEVSNPVANQAQIAQVIVNLLRNSIAAIVEDDSKIREIAVDVSQRAEHVQVSVSDTGPGLSAELNVFSPFETTKSEGLGMGLAICRSIIEAHGGRLWEDEQYKEGARLLFTLPSVLSNRYEY